MLSTTTSAPRSCAAAASAATSATSSNGLVATRPTGRSAVERADHGLGVGEVDRRDDDLTGLGAVGQGGEGAVVGRGRHHDATAVRHERQGGGHGGHAGREDEGVTTLERPERLLEGRPRRVPDAAIAHRAVRVVGRAHRQGCADLLTGGGRHTAEGHEAGGWAQLDGFHTGERIPSVAALG